MYVWHFCFSMLDKKKDQNLVPTQVKYKTSALKIMINPIDSYEYVRKGRLSMISGHFIKKIHI